MMLEIMLSTVFSATDANPCRDATDQAALAFKPRAEKLFLAYTENRIKQYEVSPPVRCDATSITVGIIGMGPDAQIGAAWTVTLHEDDKHVVIYPGE